VTVQLFFSTKAAPLTRSQELPRRLTLDIGAPVITPPSSAPSAISTSPHYDGFKAPVVQLGGDTGKSFPIIPQEDGISISEPFEIERLEAAHESVGPASSFPQDRMVLQTTVNPPHTIASTLSLLPSPTCDTALKAQEDIRAIGGAEEAPEEGKPLFMAPLGVPHELESLGSDVDGESASPSATGGPLGHTPVASAARVPPSVGVTLPMSPRESVRTLLESLSTPSTTKTTTCIETQDASLGLKPTPGDSSNCLNLIHSIPACQNRAKHNLASPFRSPLKSKKIRDENLPPFSSTDGSMAAKLGSTGKRTPGQFLLPSVPPKKPEFTLTSHFKSNPTCAAKSAFKPLTFKSPLRASAATPITHQSSPIYPSSSGPKKTPSTPIWRSSDNRLATALTIQTLERRLTLLKRAITIKSAHESEERLEDLTRKWQGVARDVSWELWAIVKQNHEDGVGGIVDMGEECDLFTKANGKSGSSDSFRSGWGWDGTDKGQSSMSGGTECGREEEQHQQEDVEKGEDLEYGLTMSVMLRQLGIAESTLGWDEVEGDFKAD
jgi:hypothetical protein